MKLTEGTFTKHEKFTNRSINKMNYVVVEVEKKKNTYEENRQRIDKIVSLACTNFAEEGIT